MAGRVPQTRETNPLVIVAAIRDLFQGRSNAVGSCTLGAGATSTDVAAINCGSNSKVFLTPTTASAAAELAAGGLFVSAVQSGQFSITHANDAATDRTFFYVCLG